MLFLNIIRLKSLHDSVFFGILCPIKPLTGGNIMETNHHPKMAEAGEYSEDGANLMIEHGWMEKPPSAPDRKVLAKG
jgi:hypothetical protein